MSRIDSKPVSLFQFSTICVAHSAAPSCCLHKKVRLVSSRSGYNLSRLIVFLDRSLFVVIARH